MPLRLAECRTMRNFTQARLAENVGVSRGTVTNWEKGARGPGVDEIVAICKALGVTPNELLGWREDESGVRPDRVTADEARLLGNYRSAPDDLKAHLLAISDLCSVARPDAK